MTSPSTGGSGLRVLQALASDERVDTVLAEVPGFSEPKVLRVVKAHAGVDPAAFLQRARAFQAVAHARVRPVRAAGQMKDARLYVVTDAVAAPHTLSARPGVPVDELVTLGLEMLEGLEAIHAAGLTLGALDPRDVLLNPTTLDVSLAGFSTDGSPEADVQSLAEVLIAAGAAGVDHAPFESTIRHTLKGAATVDALRAGLSQLHERWLSRTAVSSGKKTQLLSEERNLTGAVLGQYQLERVLGEGAMGTVYLARHQRIGRMAALKVLKAEHASNSELVQRFIQEAQAVNAIRNEHIVEVYDFGEQPMPDGSTCAYCVMELLDGRPLDSAMLEGPFSVQRASRVAQNMALALHAAHQVGVVHRDIKPENIFLQKRGGDAEFVKVLDFGVAKLLKPLGDLPRSGTQAGIVIGTPEYMAPEQALGEPTDRRVDLYAVGLVLYELLSGEQPFHADTFGKLVVEITTKPPPPLPPYTKTGERLPPALSALVMRCLEKAPDRRFQTGEELGAALAPFVEGGAHPSLPADGDDAFGRVRPSLWPKVFAAVAVVAALAAGAFFATGATADMEPARPTAAPPGPSADVQPVAPQDPPRPADVTPELVELTVSSQPAGARVSRIDTNEELGTTPLKVDLKPVETVALRFSLDGYQSLQRDVALLSNVSLSVDLAPLPKHDAPKEAAKKKPAEKKKVTKDAVLNPFDE